MTIKDKLYKGTVGTLGGLGLFLAAGPATDVAKDSSYHFFNNNQKGIEQRVEIPRKSGLENLLGTRSVYAQSDVHAGVDYEELAKQAAKVNEKNYREILPNLQQYEYDPKNNSSIFFNNMGVAYRLIGDYKKAEEMYKKAIELAPNEEGPRINLGYLYYKMDTPESRKLAEEQYTYVLNNIKPGSSFAKGIAKNALKRLGKQF